MHVRGNPPAHARTFLLTAGPARGEPILLLSMRGGDPDRKRRPPLKRATRLAPELTPSRGASLTRPALVGAEPRYGVAIMSNRFDQNRSPAVPSRLARRGPPSPRTRAGLDSIPRAELALPPRRTGKHRPSWKRALQDIISAHNDRHATKPKGVSFKTQSERAGALFRCFRDLHALGFKIRNPYCLGGRHIRALMEDWTAPEPRSRRRPLSPATIHTELSHLRTFTVWIGKPGLVLPAESYVPDPVRVARSSVAASDKSWAAREVEPDRLIGDIAAHDPWVGAELRLACAFGLRVKEAVMLQPHLAEKSGGCALDPSGAAPTLSRVIRGTKGGRLRRIPIDTPAKRAALDAAKALVRSESQYLADPARTLKQNLHRLHNVMTKFGVTRSALGVTPHGLRHGYAGDRYEAVAGSPRRCAAGQPPTPQRTSVRGCRSQRSSGTHGCRSRARTSAAGVSDPPRSPPQPRVEDEGRGSAEANPRKVGMPGVEEVVLLRRDDH